jgi:hypothetical protein
VLTWQHRITRIQMRERDQPLAQENVGDLLYQFLGRDLPDFEKAASRSDVEDLKEGDTNPFPIVSLNPDLAAWA